MQFRKPKNKYAKAKANTLCKKILRPALTFRNQRCGVTIPLKAKNGYEFLPGNKTIYNYEYLRQIYTTYVGLCLAGFIKVSKAPQDADSMMALEKQIIDIYKNTGTRIPDFVCSYEYNDQFNNIWNNQKLAHLVGKAYLQISYRSKIEPEGCFLLKQLFDKPNKKLIYAFALMHKFLGVYTWHELNLADHVTEMINYYISGFFMDEKTKKQGHIDSGNWRSSDLSFSLNYMQKETSLSALAIQEKQWENAHTDVMIAFKKALSIPIDKVQKWSKEKDPAALFLRMVLILVSHGFDLDDYACTDNNEEYELPVSECFGFLWKADDYMAAMDEYNNGQHEGGLSSICYTELYFDNGYIKNSNKKHFELITLFSKLFYFNLSTRVFDHETYDNLQASVDALYLPQWGEILYRAINNSRRKLCNGMAPDERRVYP